MGARKKLREAPGPLYIIKDSIRQFKASHANKKYLFSSPRPHSPCSSLPGPVPTPLRVTIIIELYSSLPIFRIALFTVPTVLNDLMI